MSKTADVQLPGLNCGLCGYRTCAEFQERLATTPEMISRCIYVSESTFAPGVSKATAAAGEAGGQAAACGSCGAGVAGGAACGAAPCAPAVPVAIAPAAPARMRPAATTWRDHLGREIDFYLEHFPEEPGPREIILPHNPMLTRELDVRRGDVLIGRPLGMSCGCPVTHCGVVTEVDPRTGVIVWCVTGPLQPRQSGFKDLGYYAAEGYEGLVKEYRCELKVGMRYFFQPRMCMLQWRHSGLMNYLNRNEDGYQVRVEGLWIG